MQIFSKDFLILFCVGVFSFMLSVNAKAQTNANNKDSLLDVTITLKDGTILKGTIITISIDELSLKTPFAGIVIIKQSNIVSISNNKNITDQKVVEVLNNNNDERSNGRQFRQIKPPPQAVVTHKYWWNINYQGLKKNEFYYQNIWILYNGLDYGITDNITLGGGAFFLGFVGFFNVHLRTQFKLTEGVSIGASYNHFVANDGDGGGSNSNNSLGFVSGGLTLGNAKTNLTVSIGQFNNLASSTARPESDLGVTLSGSAKISNSVYLITDNFFFDRRVNLNVNCFGLRKVSNNAVFDFGFMGFSPSERGSRSFVLAIPYLALSYKIN